MQIGGWRGSCIHSLYALAGCAYSLELACRQHLVFGALLLVNSNLLGCLPQPLKKFGCGCMKTERALPPDKVSHVQFDQHVG